MFENVPSDIGCHQGRRNVVSETDFDLKAADTYLFNLRFSAFKGCSAPPKPAEKA